MLPAQAEGHKMPGMFFFFIPFFFFQLWLEAAVDNI